MTRANFKAAYRNARLLNFGTLFFSMRKEIAQRVIKCMDDGRHAAMMTAKMFKNCGYYEKGMKRL